MMLATIDIRPVQDLEYGILSVLVGQLLGEIMDKTGKQAFNYDCGETEERLRHLISENKYWVFVAEEKKSNNIVGFVSLYESYALYSEGAYGTIPELYVTQNWRSKLVGQQLLKTVTKFSQEKGWKMLEVTTPQLPEFGETLRFYQSNGFEITGGRKLRANL